MMRISLHCRCQACDPEDVISRAWDKIPELSISRNPLCSFLQCRGELRVLVKQHLTLVKDKWKENEPLGEAARLGWVNRGVMWQGAFTWPVTLSES